MCVLQRDGLLCEACGAGDSFDQLLVCDSCGRVFHARCLSPPLDRLPRAAWRCSDCLALVTGLPYCRVAVVYLLRFDVQQRRWRSLEKVLGTCYVQRFRKTDNSLEIGFIN